jgi:microcystin-dependent protein
MKTNIQTGLVALALLALLTINSQLSTVFAQGTTAFTYQGRLNSGPDAANGTYDMTFAVWDNNVSGNKIAGPITNSTVAVSNGLFTVTLDFGPGVFTGTNYWVELGVRTNGAASFATLVPRQQLTPTPYALYSLQASNALSLSASSPQVNSLCPVGSIMAYMGTTAPPGWRLCNGDLVSRTEYAALFAVIGTSSGAGDGATTFRLPDTRGLFLRGWNAGTGRDPDAAARTIFDTGGNSGDAIGSYQGDGIRAHTHKTFTLSISGYLTPGPNGSFSYNPGTGSDSGSTGGNETRPKNFYVNYIIKY